MSDQTYFYIKVISPITWKNFLSQNSNKSIYVHPSNSNRLEVNVSFVSEYFIDGLRFIIKKCCLDKLYFLCLDYYTHEFYFQVDSIGKTVHEEKIFFTAIENNYHETINQINSLIEWCKINTSEIVKIFNLNETQEKIIQSIENSSFLLNQSRDSLNRLCWEKNSKLLFDFLFTVKSILISAQESNNFFVYHVVRDLDVSRY